MYSIELSKGFAQTNPVTLFLAVESSNCSWEEMAKVLIFQSNIKEVKKMNKKFLGVWQVLVLAAVLLSLFMFFIPYWVRRFDVVMPFFRFGVFKYCGAIIFFAALFFCLYSVFFMVKKTGSIPVNRVKGGAPQTLVVNGPYRFVRNPQQIAAILMLLGLTIYFESVSILIYTIVVAVFSHIHVVFVEEKGLRKFGSDYENYCEDVPRWFPKLWKKSGNNVGDGK